MSDSRKDDLSVRAKIFAGAYGSNVVLFAFNEFLKNSFGNLLMGADDNDQTTNTNKMLVFIQESKSNLLIASSLGVKLGDETNRQSSIDAELDKTPGSPQQHIFRAASRIAQRLVPLDPPVACQTATDCDKTYMCVEYPI